LGIAAGVVALAVGTAILITLRRRKSARVGQSPEASLGTSMTGSQVTRGADNRSIHSEGSEIAPATIPGSTMEEHISAV